MSSVEQFKSKGKSLPTAKPVTKKRADKTADPVVQSFKGFDSNLACRGFQFEVGQTYEVGGKTVACKNGFHSCENPFDVLNYYGLIDSRFCVVLASGEIARHGSDSKIASAKIAIEAELKLPEFIGKCITYLLGTAKGENVQVASRDSSQLAASGDYSKLEINGAKSAAAGVGNGSAIKAAKGTPIAICEYDPNGNPKGFATGIAGKDCPADTWLIAKGGKLVEQ